VLLATLGAVFGFGPPAGAVSVPAEGSCPPYPITPGTGSEDITPDVVPPALLPGRRVGFGDLEQIRHYLPGEVWSRRDVFFHDGMRLQVGPCHRRYPAPSFFQDGTKENAGKAGLDEEGNLLDYAGEGLPFPPESIARDAPDAGTRWAWNYAYRYIGAAPRGNFRILHVDPRKGKGERFEGTFAWVPLHGIPDQPRNRPRGHRFAVAGKFLAPAIARGVAWRQLRPDETDRDYRRADDIFVWLPEARKVKRAPPQSMDGLFMPSYTRGASGSSNVLSLPDLSGVTVPDESFATIEHWRRGFVGLMIRPNAYRWNFVRVQDVLSPINAIGFGFPSDQDRAYGTTGLSLGNDRWDVRRAVVIHGTRREPDKKFSAMTLWIDVLTQQPLYLVTRKPNSLVYEVGIFMGKFSADDPIQTRWKGNGENFGVIHPVAAAFNVAGTGSWLRESFEVRSDPPDDGEFRDITSTVRLQHGH
jgi:hypothetical protein